MIALMTAMNISLPPSLKSFIEHRVDQCGYGSDSAYIQTLIQADQEKLWLRERILSSMEIRW